MKDYGKLVDGQLIKFEELSLTYNNVTYCPPTDEIMAEQGLALGWKEIVYTPYPEDGNTYSSAWIEEDTQLIQNWVLEYELTPAEKREWCYKNYPICPLLGKDYTCDELENLYWHYASEFGQENKAQKLKDLITIGKNTIREMYPDIDEVSDNI